MPYEPEDSQIWESRANLSWGCTLSGRSYLEEIKTELEEGRRQWRAGANLLAAFGYVRRRKTAVDAINKDLEDLGLVCAPPIDVDMPLDTPRIRFPSGWLDC